MKRSTGTIEADPAKARRRVPDENNYGASGVVLLVSGTTHQGDRRFLGNGVQCTAMAYAGSALSVTKNRFIFTVADINTILECGDALYVALEPRIPAHVYPRYLNADELPCEIRVGEHVVRIDNMVNSWIRNGLYPACNDETNKEAAILRLANLLGDAVFDGSHSDDTDSVLFTGNGYTVCFWRHQNQFYIFNSHAVDELNRNSFAGVARLFRCNDLRCLAKTLIDYNCAFDGSEYSLNRVRVLDYRSAEDTLVSPIQDSDTTMTIDLVSPSVVATPTQSVDIGQCSMEPTQRSETILNNFVSPSVVGTPIETIVIGQCSIDGTQGSESILNNSERSVVVQTSRANVGTTFAKSGACAAFKNNDMLTQLNPVVVLEDIGDFKLSILKPVVVIEPLAMQTSKPPTKRGRPKKQVRGRKSTKENAHLDAVKKYNLKKPEINRESSKKYTDKNPEIHRKSVQKYTETNPDVHCTSVQKYTEKNPDVHRKSVQKYTENNPDVHRISVQKYTENNPDIHRISVQKYTENNPDIHRKSVQKYTENNPDVNRKSVQKYSDKNPDVNRKSVQKYTENNPEINQNSVTRYNKVSRNIDVPLRRSHNLIGEKNGEELQAVNQFSLKKPSLFSPDVYKCPHCGTRLFDEEKSRTQWCCGSGANNVLGLFPLTEEFYTHPSFVQRPRAYNNLFCFSALGVSHGFQHPQGLSFLKIQGRVYHRVFDLGYNRSTNNIGLYINDGSERESLAIGQSLDVQVVRSITNYLHNVNPHIECFKRLSLETSPEAFIKFERTSRETHGNILGDQPVGREVAAIICTEREQYTPHCIAVWKIGECKPHTVDILNLMYESFQYPLLYPEGSAGWFPGKTDNCGNKLTQAKYVRCLLLSESRFSHLGRLSEEWLVDMYCRISEERLRYLKHMQTQNHSNEMRAAPLQELVNDETIAAEGVVPGRIYLPSTFTGGPRYMKVKYLDCIALVNRLGPPSYFITFTCNPNWPEIKRSTPSGQRANPLICARAFNLRLTALIRDFRSGLWFGKIEYLTYVIEFQKRGLPHAHICFRVEGGGPVENCDIDKVCRADIPAEEEEGPLRQSVLDHMIHGPCGPERDNLPCYDKEKRTCSKRFPKRETDVTFSDEKGFINLRRNSKNEAVIKYRGREFKVNDLWVVPYNAALLLKYDAHINVEVSSRRSVIKYLFKYMTKGPDEARVALIPEDRSNEIENYVTKRYIGSSDAAWRVLEFDVTAREPNVKQLSVHLANQQTVYFRPSNIDEAIARGGSDLITYFNRPLGAEFDNLKYVDFYEKFIVHAKRPSTKKVQVHETTNGKFITPRQRGEIVARLFWVAPNRGEQFYLRILLNCFPCRSYADLIGLGGADCTTFQDAAKAVGLADDEIEYEGAMLEASTFFTGSRLRKFFVLLAVNGAPVASLWDKFKNQLSEDILHRMPNEEEKAHKLCLIQIKRLLGKHGASLVQHGLPDVQDDTTELGRERVEYSRNVQVSIVAEWLPKLSSEQRAVFEYVDRLCVDEQYREANSTAIFIDGPAGTGKTLLLNVITAHVRGGDSTGVVLCTASSAIAAQNYEGGVTAHSMFKFPLDPVDDSGYWNITNGTQRANLIFHADVLIYDEAPMAHKYLIHLLDRSLRDLMKSDKIFGGKIIIFAGDFRQIPPVVPNARCNSDILNCSVKTSPLWRKLKTFSLLTSQRCRDDPEYADFLLKLGSNALPTETLETGDRNTQRLVRLELVEYVSRMQELIDFVFPHVVIDEPDVCAHRAILCTRNDAVREINVEILRKVPGEMLHFYSFDKVESENADQLFLGTDALNRIRPPGVPEFDLKLKIGCVCMIMRNLSFADGLVNGTKVIVEAATPRLITVRKPGGHENYLIPRILFKAPVERNSPFEMCRRQFPLQVCYAMTIHKSQGQTIGRVGVDLRSDVFSHGQLYVALGRVRERTNIRVLVHTNRIRNGACFANNVVIPELL